MNEQYEQKYKKLTATQLTNVANDDAAMIKKKLINERRH